MTNLKTLTAAKEKYLRKLKQKKYRREYGQYICEGIRVFNEAIQVQNLKITEVIIQDDQIPLFNLKNFTRIAALLKTNFYYCNKETMRRLSEDVTPPGILFTVRSVDYSAEDLYIANESYLIYLDRISDPGNLGTIIRTSLWFGISTIVLSPDSAEPYNPKTVRATAGAIFRAKIIRDVSVQDLSEFADSRNYTLISTIPHRGEKVETWIPPEKCIICMGSEAEGLNPEILAQSQTLLSILGGGLVDSLNLAVSAGIILHRIHQFAQREQ